MDRSKSDSLINKVLDYARGLSRSQKRLAMMAFDTSIIAFSLWASVSLRLGDPWPADIWTNGWWMLVALPLGTVWIFHHMRVYRQILRSTGLRSAIQILQATMIATLGFVVIGFFFRSVAIPRSTPLIFFFVSVPLLIGFRRVAQIIYDTILRGSAVRQPVIIYGAGAAGIQLLTALKVSDDYQPVAFIDDDTAMKSSLVEGRRVYPSQKIDYLIKRFDVHDVFLAMPSVDTARKREILIFLSERRLRVKEIPPIQDMINLVSGEAKLRTVEIEDLVGREAVAPSLDLFECVRGKNVLITGAGGSIGSELCRQIITRAPRSIVLFEMSEFALYSIDQELQTFPEAASVEIVPVIGSVCNGQRLAEKISRHRIQTLFHAAAYKHVPLVEANPLEGVRNNTIGTLEVAKAAVENGVDRAILISTDKAVRPTNVMGASKRMAELAFQYWQEAPGQTMLCMVRFGNVIGSSGSVIPLFKKQIEQGGPVTVTHPEIMRYFMTIPEAAQLVVQAGSLGTGGDVFLLDMGQPVAILDLARRMIHLAGHDIRDESNPDGDMEVHFTGLRPGEKLYEELLIDGNSTATLHPKILREPSGGINREVLQEDFSRLARALDRSDERAVREILERHVEGFGAVGQAAQ